MREIFKGLEDAVKAGKPAVLCTILASSGSTPRGAGAMMVVTEQGRTAGTIGGGAIEFQSEKIASEVLKTKETRVQPFLLRKNDVQDIGMICGGDAQVEFYYIDPSDPETMRKYEELEEEVRKLATVFIFGGGHVAQALVPVLASLEFNTVVLDDREDYCRKELFSGVTETKVMDLENVTAGLHITEDDYVCIMTRGHKDDLEVEYQILKTPAKYIGVIGSAKKTAGVNQKLMDRGIREEELQRITTPIGFKLRGAQTPAEISICIAAQLIEVRSGFEPRNAEAAE